MFHNGGENSDHETADEVHAECAEREAPTLSLMENDAAEFVARYRTDSAAECYHEYLFNINAAT